MCTCTLHKQVDYVKYIYIIGYLKLIICISTVAGPRSSIYDDYIFLVQNYLWFSLYTRNYNNYIISG